MVFSKTVHVHSLQIVIVGSSLVRPLHNLSSFKKGGIRRHFIVKVQLS